MTECFECGKELKFWEGYHHLELDKKELVCWNCYETLEKSMEEYRNFILHGFIKKEQKKAAKNNKSEFSNIWNNIKISH